MKIFTRGKASKKASLSLSMEAIVILILAITMLGLGLSFVRGMFTKIGAQTDEAMGLGEITCAASESAPLCFTPNRPDIKEKKATSVDIGFYNPSTTETFWLMQVEDDDAVCGGKEDATGCYVDQLSTGYRTKTFKLEKDNSRGLNVIFTPKAGFTNNEPTRPVLLTASFCASEEDSDTCKTDAEVYEKEMFVTVRK